MLPVRPLRALDKLLLATLLPAWGLALLLHLQSLIALELVQPTVFLQQRSGVHPVVAGYLVETGPGHAELQSGDVVRAVAGVDMRGRGDLAFRGLTLSRADARRQVAIEAERGGEPVHATLTLVASPIPWGKTPTIALAVLAATLILMRAADVRMARLLFAGTLFVALGQTTYYGASYTQTVVYWVVFWLGTALGAPLILRALSLLPRGGSFPAAAANAWCVALGLLYFVMRLSANWIGPLSARAASQTILAVDAAFLGSMVVAITWNFRRADAGGRRQLKWLMFGAYLGVAPLTATLLVPVVAPGSAWFEPLFIASSFAMLALPLGVLIGIVRDNLFDIDRLISATASYSLVLLALLAVLLTVVRGASGPTSELLGIDTASAQTLLAMTLAAVAVALQGRVRPRVDAFFFPERRALEEGAGRLRALLASAKDPGAVLILLARETAELLRPRYCVVHAATQHGFAPAFVQPVGAAGQVPLEILEETRSRPRLLEGDTAAVVPIRSGDARVAALELGPKRSGDVYTATDLNILAGLADGAGAELLRFHQNETREEGARMIAALRNERDRAEHASREKTHLLASTSHDLRQPLHALALFTETLAERELDPEARELVERIQASAEALEASFTSLLDLSRIEAGAVEKEIGDVALGPLLTRLVREFADAAERKGIALSAVRTSLHVQSDPVLLGRIVQNLVSNAVRYTREGRVTLDVRAEGGKAFVAVRDTGPGIPRDAQREIFREFRRLESSAAAAPGGAGLGLAIVDRLVRLLGLELRLESVPGRGSCFELALPLAEGAPRAEVAVAPAPARAARGFDGRRVLVIDDDPSVRDAMQRLLTQWGCVVTTAADGAEARATVDAAPPPDLLVVDYGLSDGENGADLVAALRAALGAELPALIVTAETASATLAGIRARGLPVLSKPVPPHRLRAALAGFVAGPVADVPDP
jgi:signal transduction histidine kinase/CheY-like chemotaxis protein